MRVLSSEPIFTFKIITNLMKSYISILMLELLVASCSLLPPKKIWLHELDLSKMTRVSVRMPSAK